MNNSFLKPYTLVIQTISPVHVGTGIKLGKTDFVLQNGHLHVIDENKLMAWIIGQSNAEQLALALADDLRRPNSGIGKFLSERFRGNLSQITAYRLPYQGSPKDVSTFMKTVDYQPYLPGSSVKGVLRSGLLRGKMLGDKSLQEQATQAMKQGALNSGKPKTNSDKIQANVFVGATDNPHTWPNFDVYRLLIVRDSSASSPDDLEIVAVKTLSIQTDTSLQPKPFDIFVEALLPKKLFQHSIVWQTNLLGDAARSLGFQALEGLIVFLPEYCRRVSHNLLTQEQAFYRRHGHADLAAWFEKRLALLDKNPDVFILPMGWGSGYDAKTITDLLGTATFKKVVDTYKNTWGLGKPGRQKEAPWLGLDDSPKSRKVVVRPNGATEPMGWMAMRIIPTQESDNWLEKRREMLVEYKPSIEIAQPVVIPIDHPTPPLSSTSPTPQPTPSQPTPPPATQAAATHPPQPPPAPPTLAPKAVPPHPRTPIQTYTALNLPQPGERFEGKVWFTEENGTVFVVIPHLDPDELAAATFRPAKFDRRKLVEGDKVTLTVKKVEQDAGQSGHWLVHCERE